MQYWIDKFNLQRHIEGGYFARTYASKDQVTPFSKRYQKTDELINNNRAAGSAIYFLLAKDDFSAWHKLKSDEMWHFYTGNSVIIIHYIDANGSYQRKLLGNSQINSQADFQVLIPSETWFSAELENKTEYALVGCTVFPGFIYQDFELANRNNLIEKFPQHANIIKRLTHEKNTTEMSK